MELEVKAAAFAEKWRGKGYERGETQLFYRDLFEIFDVPVERVAVFEHAVQRLGRGSGYIDLFWKGRVLVEQKSAGSSLEQAKRQAFEYCEDLSDAEHPRYVLLSDFQTFELYDLRDSEEARFHLQDLAQHIHKLGFIAGDDSADLSEQEKVNIQAAELVGRLHDELEAAGYTGQDLERLLVRIVFCLFADNTGIFPRNAFLNLIDKQTSKTGADVGPLLASLFQVLDTPEDQRQASQQLAGFPYVNGDLFAGPLRIPAFNGKMRELLLAACRFDWTAISPAIFGSLFQSVMDREARRSLGAHYTTEPNILKVIESLFLRDLRMEFNRIRRLKGANRVAKLKAFQQKLAGLTFFDPACGCGNFLIIAYRELRLLELKVLRELRKDKGQLALDVASLSLLNVDQFHGIEISEFPVRIAEAAMWMMDHIMNKQMSEEFGEYYIRIPLTRSPAILQADALETDWRQVLPPENCSFIMGNPPFAGAKLQSQAQREQIKRLANLGGAGGTLDYVAAWFIKAAEYIQQGDAKIGFVATNSITQGEQVGQLWPLLLERYGMEITFAHQTFAWGSDAKGKAHVHVVILGLSRPPTNSPPATITPPAEGEFANGKAVGGGGAPSAVTPPTPRPLFTYSDPKADSEESPHPAISPYLVGVEDASKSPIVVHESAQPLNGLPKVGAGSQVIDGGFTIFKTEAEKDEFLVREPGASKFVRPYIGAQDFINGTWRWVLTLHDASPAELAKMPAVKERLGKVREWRQASKRKATREMAQTPTAWQIKAIPDSPFLVIPVTSSERREYVPIGWLEPPFVPNTDLRIVGDASKALFGLLTSSMHMAWLQFIRGRLESRYRYSLGIVYNTFPVPEAGYARLEAPADAILQARATHPESTLANLYDPDLMPPSLRKAHQKLDKATDSLYRKAPFHSNQERAAHLLTLYKKMTARGSTPASP